MKRIKVLLLLIIFNLYYTRISDTHKEYTLQSNNRKFQILTDLNDKILITLMEIDVISSYYFYTELSLESLCKYNKIFKQ